MSQNAPFISQSNPQLSLWRPETVATEVVGGDPGDGERPGALKMPGDIPSFTPYSVPRLQCTATGHKIEMRFQGVQSGRGSRIEPRPCPPAVICCSTGLSPDLMHAISFTAHRPHRSAKS